jgi:CMP-N,N'-diacetyllegionaminic acid synthase
MRVLGLIPARGGSTRLLRKNLAVLEGTTLVRRCLAMALRCPDLDAVCLSSDDPEILAQASGLDGVIALARPPALAGATAPVADAVLHALAAIEGEGAARFDAVALVQCTSPFTEPDDISQAIALLARSGAECAVTVAQVEHALHPYKFKRLVGERLEPLFEDDAGRPAPDLPEVWVRDGAVYVARRDLVERRRMISEDCVALPMPRERSLDINDARDLAVARVMSAALASGRP